MSGRKYDGDGQRYYVASHGDASNPYYQIFDRERGTYMPTFHRVLAAAHGEARNLNAAVACNAHDTLRAENARLREALALAADRIDIDANIFADRVEAGDETLTEDAVACAGVSIKARAALKGGA